ncbi:hypothetical protein AURDEDRAFT_117242 [Auricularia subglabra TFB-10046 SS5]|uniref:Uncharacterized protein n=1 Tax=Auricularia subglabra (strain TFB-10046 / SS5) TaxID=717982 RepID=J0LF87_AURST|nr:hypothetical protein AURDEDRAFT_117242 [Auricularia subglabra TFB-10046 SS5]
MRTEPRICVLQCVPKIVHLSRRQHCTEGGRASEWGGDCNFDTRTVVHDGPQCQLIVAHTHSNTPQRVTKRRFALEN